MLTHSETCKSTCFQNRDSLMRRFPTAARASTSRAAMRGGHRAMHLQHGSPLSATEVARVVNSPSAAHRSKAAERLSSTSRRTTPVERRRHQDAGARARARIRARCSCCAPACFVLLMGQAMQGAERYDALYTAAAAATKTRIVTGVSAWARHSCNQDGPVEGAHLVLHQQGVNLIFHRLAAATNVCALWQVGG